MKINLWFSKPTQVWRWTLVTEEDPFMMESGQSGELTGAMDDVGNTVKWLMDSKSNHFAHD